MRTRSARSSQPNPWARPAGLCWPIQKENRITELGDMGSRSGSPFNAHLIAPCGIHCGVCKAYLREKNRCNGCRNLQQNLRKSIAACRMRLCDKREGMFCSSCNEFPCAHLRHLDERYRKRYDMSEIEDLIAIRDNGVEKFLETEYAKWCSVKGILCVHDKKYYGIRKDERGSYYKERFAEDMHLRQRFSPC
jgi:hypothetical protein